MDSYEFDLDTGSAFATDLTFDLANFCRGRGDGLVNIFVPHATAGVAIFELGAGSEGDIEAALERLLPTQDIYRHRHGSLGHGRDHVVPAFVSPSMSIPVLAGTPTLGTWQSVVLIDPNGDNPRRKVRFSFLRSA